MHAPKLFIPAAFTTAAGLGLDIVGNTLAQVWPTAPYEVWLALFLAGVILTLALPAWLIWNFRPIHFFKQLKGDGGSLKADLQVWRKVDPLYVWQAGCLWKGVSPRYPVTYDNPAYGTFSMLLRAVERGDIKPVSIMPQSRLAYAQISHSELKKFALLNGENPAFLSDMAPPQATPQETWPRRRFIGFAIGLILAIGVLFWNWIDYRNQFIACTPKAEWQSTVIDAIDPQLNEPAAVRQILLTRRSHTPYTMTILGSEGGLRNLNAVWLGMKPDSVSKREYGGIELLLKDPVGLVSIIIAPRKMADTKLGISFRCIK